MGMKLLKRLCERRKLKFMLIPDGTIKGRQKLILK
jgi:hypothetical protein